jgi:hypothetical protein
MECRWAHGMLSAVQKKMHAENIVLDCWRTNLRAELYEGEKTYIREKQ